MENLNQTNQVSKSFCLLEEEVVVEQETRSVCCRVSSWKPEAGKCIFPQAVSHKYRNHAFDSPNNTQYSSWCLALRECSINTADRINGETCKCQSLKNSRYLINTCQINKRLNALSSILTLKRIINDYN